MSPADRKKILIAGGIALVAIIVLIFILRARGGGSAAVGPGDFAGGDVQAEEGAAPAATGEAPATGETPAAPGATEAAAGEGEAAEGEAAAVRAGNVIRMGGGSSVMTRDDPFITFEPEPQPARPELIVNLPPGHLPSRGLRPAGIPEVAQIGRRRVAGLLFNDRAWAILEREGETFIVKPGDRIDGNLITAIARDSVFLIDDQGRRWQVPLRGLGPGAGASAPAASRISGMP